MKRVLVLMVGAAVIVALAGAALAFMGPYGRMGPGTAMGPGAGMGPGSHMMGARGAGATGCPGMAGTADPTVAPITEERAKELAQGYADRYLPGFTVEKVLPFTGRMHTMYSVELKGPDGEIRVLHVNPFGNVMPFGGPWRRGV
jgi:hypothetical protein